ncbi:alanyl-tRNA synthetase [Catenulispora sp. GP43]|uniref:metal-dependent hydrolase n=1 Tax=Catenulispora sp. GP43 TaxID=3156263 RepID=UPI0035187ECC
MVHYNGTPEGFGQVSAYYHDTYEDQAATRVVAVGTLDGAPWVAVEHCLFHPQGGGQPADRGWVDDHEIVPVRDRDTGLIVAVSAVSAASPQGSGDDPLPTLPTLPAFETGQRVKARIDLQARMQHAALHTAGHLVEAACRAQGWALAASNHFPGQARIEFTAPESDVRLQSPDGREEATEAVRAAVAGAVARDLAVTWELDDAGRRIVHLDGLHAAPCGGTHVRSLGDLAGITLPTLKVKKGRIRVSYDAAHRER